METFAYPHKNVFEHNIIDNCHHRASHHYNYTALILI